MIKLRKVVAPILVVSMLAVLLLAGCGAGSSANNQDSSGTAGAAGIASSAGSGEEPAVDPKMTEPVTLRWFNFGWGTESTRDYDKVMDQFNTQLGNLLPNTKVEIVPTAYAEYKQKWDLAMASGEQLDIAWAGFLLVLVDEVLKGSFMPLDDLYAKYGADIAKEVPSWYMDYGKVKGKQYVIPVYGGSGKRDLMMGMFTPKDLFDKYWDKSWNQVFYNVNTTYRQATKEMYDVFEAYMKKLKDASSLQSGFSPMMWQMNDGAKLTGDDPWRLRLPRNGQKWDFTVVNYYELPEVKLMFQTMSDWYKKGYIRKDIISLSNLRIYENTATGKDGDTLWFHQYNDYESPNSEYRYITDPTGVNVPQAQARLENYYYNTAIDAASSQAIPRTAQNPERAMALLNLLNSSQGKDLLHTLVYGIEGVNYKMVGSNRIEKTLGDDPKNPNYAGFSDYTIGSAVNYYLTDPAQPDNLYQNTTSGATIINSPLIGIKPDISSVKTEVTNIRAIIAEYRNTLLCGAAGDQWEKVYNEFTDKLKVAGVDKVIAEMQKQVDEVIQQKGIDRNNTVAK